MVPPPKARIIVLVFAGVVLHPGVAPAQKVVSAKAGLVFFVQGRASVEGGALSTGEHFRQLKPGESLSTERGRAEVLLNPGVILRLGDMSRLHMDDVKLTDACVSLESGSAVVTVNYILKYDHVRLVAAGSVIVMEQEGVYRIDVTQVDIARARLRVFNGKAEVRRDDGSAGRVIVKRGQSVNLDDGLNVAKFDVKDTDALQRWASARSRTLAPREFRLHPQPPNFGGSRNDPIPDASSAAGMSMSHHLTLP
jgi:hypothetical protein